MLVPLDLISTSVECFMPTFGTSKRERAAGEVRLSFRQITKKGKSDLALFATNHQIPFTGLEEHWGTHSSLKRKCRNIECQAK